MHERKYLSDIDIFILLAFLNIFSKITDFFHLFHPFYVLSIHSPLFKKKIKKKYWKMNIWWFFFSVVTHRQVDLPP